MIVLDGIERKESFDKPKETYRKMVDTTILFMRFFPQFCLKNVTFSEKLRFFEKCFFR